MKNSLARVCFALLCALTVLTAASSAFAYGRVQWSKTTLEERQKKGAWRIELKIFLNRAPDVAYVPVKFEFEPVAYYERSLVDGSDKVQERTVPLTNQQSLIESVDLGFLDPGTGQILPRTRFTFKVTRGHGFEAGEYKVTIRDSDGKQIGTTQLVKFKGENETIDRRSIVFSGDKKKKKEEPKEEASEEAASETEAESSDTASEETYDEPAYDDEGDAPPAIEEKPGGCGCHHGPSHGEHLGWMLFAMLVGGVAWRRYGRWL